MVNVIYVVKALTGNIKIVHTYKFGHGVSYNQLEENDTAYIQEIAVCFN